MSKPNRLDLGAHFTEGARLLWLAIRREDLSASKAAAAIDADAGLFHRWLYGDKRPGRLWSAKVFDRFRVPVSAWDKDVTRPFMPPAAEAPDEDPNAVADEAPDPISPQNDGPVVVREGFDQTEAA